MPRRTPVPPRSLPDPAEELCATDDILAQAGLARNPRGKAPLPAPARAMKSQVFTPEELSAPAPIPYTAPKGVPYLRAEGWSSIPWLWHGFSTRLGGVSRAYCPEGGPGELNLGFTPQDDRALVLKNRELLAEAVTGKSAIPLVTLRQIHSSVVVLSGEPRPALAESQPCKGDGIMTARPGLLLGIQTADCIPVLVADRRRRAVAAFHAGWRGTVKRIVELGIGRMRLEFGSQPEDLVAAIGPGIGACCYAVGEEVISEFESQFSYAGELLREVYDTDALRNKYPLLFLSKRPPGRTPSGHRIHLDLIEANRRQLVSAGLNEAAIQIVRGCTNCHPELFFSYRNSQGHCGRMMSVIGIAPQ